MTTVANTPVQLSEDNARLADRLIGWLETGVRPADMFAADMTLTPASPRFSGWPEASSTT